MVGASVLLTWTLLSKTFNELGLSILFPLPGAGAYIGQSISSH